MSENLGKSADQSSRNGSMIDQKSQKNQDIAELTKSIDYRGSGEGIILNDGRQVKKESDGAFYVIEKIDISEPGSEINSEGEGEGGAQISDLDEITASEKDLENLDQLIKDTKSPNLLTDSNLLNRNGSTGILSRAEPKNINREAVIDDFIRNFLIKMKMEKTLEAFQQEWYELASKGKFSTGDLEAVPDVYIKNEKLELKVESLKRELDASRIAVEKAKDTWDKLRRERDFHKMHHNRVQQEKHKLNHEIERLKRMYKDFEDKYTDLSAKYEMAMKEKMLIKLERDRLISKSEALQKTVENLEQKVGKDIEKSSEKLPELNEKSTLKTSKSTKIKLTLIPTQDRLNPLLNSVSEYSNIKALGVHKVFKKAHMMPISSIAMHPKKSIIATASDDLTWKIWTIPNGELIMSGEGHKDWVSGIDFHPRGTHLATSSGDSSIRIWDFIHASCVMTFKEHIQPVWMVKFHDTGDFVVSCSMDHTCKLFDLATGKTRQVFRGHVDSVNHIMFQPYTNTFASASADKTVSLWDIRSGLCTQTFYGHLNAVNHVSFDIKQYEGINLCSADTDGIVKTWDVRMTKQRMQCDTGNFSANSCTFDRSGNGIAVASDDGLVKLINEATGKIENSLKGHEDAVQDIAFDYNSKMLVSVGSDASFIIWQQFISPANHF